MWLYQIQKRKKIKDASKGENLPKAPEDGGFNLPIYKYQERSMLLVEQAKSINVGTTKNPKITYHATSLDPEEISRFIALINDTKVNFYWTYVEIPGLDPALVVHHLDVVPEANTIEQKIKKIRYHYW